jgi:hypothetical protein
VPIETEKQRQNKKQKETSASKILRANLDVKNKKKDFHRVVSIRRFESEVVRAIEDCVILHHIWAISRRGRAQGIEESVPDHIFCGK